MESIFLSEPCLKPTVDNLRFSQPPIDGFFSQGTLLRFECDSGYTLLFPRPDFDSSVCQPNGTWFPPIPTCILEGIYYVFYNKEWVFNCTI